MFKLKMIFLIVVVHTLFLYPQISKNLSDEFYRSWLISEYYDEIKNGKMPTEINFNKPILQFHFFEGKDSAFCFSICDGMERDFEIKSSDTVIIYQQFNKSKIEFVISLFKENDESKLLADDGNEKYVFIGLDKKYTDYFTVSHFINEELIQGEYISSTDSTVQVTFTADGKVTGLKNLARYRIPLQIIDVPKDFPVIIFYDDYMNKLKVFNINKTGDVIQLFNIFEEENDSSRYGEAKILDKFVELKKRK
jgi:hypothetical protein